MYSSRRITQFGVRGVEEYGNRLPVFVPCVRRLDEMSMREFVLPATMGDTTTSAAFASLFTGKA
jgi:hypothetical protein